MSKFITSLALIATILASASVAQADQMYGNALRDAAQAGQITPHGVFEGR